MATITLGGIGKCMPQSFIFRGMMKVATWSLTFVLHSLNVGGGDDGALCCSSSFRLCWYKPPVYSHCCQWNHHQVCREERKRLYHIGGLSPPSYSLQLGSKKIIAKYPYVNLIQIKLHVASVRHSSEHDTGMQCVVDQQMQGLHCVASTMCSSLLASHSEA